MGNVHLPLYWATAHCIHHEKCQFQLSDGFEPKASQRIDFVMDEKWFPVNQTGAVSGSDLFFLFCCC